jgi:NAD(P)-dependent dehydrogenase (short-subunit alcohol dehydrogenase family)
MARGRREIAGKRVLVSGALGGFGRAVSDLLERRGARVIGLDLEADDDREVLACDITDADGVERAVAEAAVRLGGIDVLVNNAGIGTAQPVACGPEPDDRVVIETNLIGTWNLTAAALPWLADANGHVVNVASLLAVVNLPYSAAYTASKRGVCALSDVLRVEHGDRIAVTTVYPGYSATAIHGPAEERTGMSLAGRVPEEGPERVARWIAYAIERRPRDIATSRGGNVILRIARHAPKLVERAGRRRAERSGEPVERPTIPPPRTSAGTR